MSQIGTRTGGFKVTEQALTHGEKHMPLGLPNISSPVCGMNWREKSGVRQSLWKPQSTALRRISKRPTPRYLAHFDVVIVGD